MSSGVFGGCSTDLKIYCNAVGAEWDSEWNAYENSEGGLSRYEPITGVETYEDYLALINA